MEGAAAARVEIWTSGTLARTVRRDMPRRVRGLGMVHSICRNGSRDRANLACHEHRSRRPNPGGLRGLMNVPPTSSKRDNRPSVASNSARATQSATGETETESCRAEELVAKAQCPGAVHRSG